MRTSLIAVAAFLALLNPALAAAPTPHTAKPSPQLSPREVVQLQLDALKRVDQPTKDAGFVTVFRFSSPENRAQTGPLPRFSKMIREGFGELLNHRSATLAATLQQGNQALQPVEIISVGGQRYRYVFVLRRQDTDDCRQCWMTDGVIPKDDTEGSQEL